MQKTYGFGIIGCGVIAKWHSDSIAAIENAKLIGVFDNFKESAQRFSEANNCKAFNTLEEMLASEEIDVICICTPSGTHAPLAIQAANAKKNVVVEKPVAITEKQLSELVSAVEENGVKLAVISQLRFSETVQIVKKAIDEGRLGKLLVCDVFMKYYRSPEYYANSGWRGTWAMDGGGALMNQGIHGIDILTYLAGPVKAISGFCKTLDREIEVEDAACLSVEYQNGAIGLIQGTTCVTPGYPRRTEICGTKGTVVIEEDSIVKWDIEGENGSRYISETSVNTSSDPTAFDLQNHRKQIENLLDSIENDTTPLVDIYEGKKTVEIILGAYEASKTGKKVVL